MSVYYLRGKSNYGNSAGVEGYYYPLYTSSNDIAGQYHEHTFEGLDGVVFYMPNGVMNHGVSGIPTAAAYNNETYLEYATYNFDLDTNTISYTNRPEASLVVSSVAQYSPKQTTPYNERTSNKESSAVEDLIPLQLRESAETLTALLEDYYEYLNTNGQVLNVSKRILTEHDIDETSSDYLKKIQQEVAISVPDSRVLDTVSLYKRIVNYYSIRGSEESVLVFFKLFFDEIVEVFYPKDFLLKPSDGDWIQNDNILNYENTLTGTASNNLLSVDSAGESLKFYNDSDVEIGVGQIQRIEKIRSGKNLTHPDTEFLFLEVDTSESERYNPDENTFRVYNPQGGAFSQTVAELKNGVSYSQENGFLFTDDSGGSSWDRNHIDLGQIYNTNTEIATANDTNSHTMVAQIKLNGGNAGPVHLFSDSSNYPGLQIGITNSKVNYETWRWGTANGYNSEIQSGTAVIPNGQHATVAVRGKRDVDATADGNSGKISLIDNIILNDAFRIAGTYSGVSSTSGGGGTGATFDVVVHSTAIESISNQSGADPSRVPGTYNITSTSVTYINGDGLHTSPNLTVVIDEFGEASITINSGGKGFTVGDTVYIEGGYLGGAGAEELTFEVASLTSNVSSVTLSSPGSGYSPGDSITILETDFGNPNSTEVATNNLSIDVKAIELFDTEDAAAGNGYIDVSVNGETWERVWDDSDYGTPTSFDIKSAAVYYAPEDGGLLTTQVDINGFVKAGTSSNGSDYYEADFANVVINGNSANNWVYQVTTGGLQGNFDKYVIEYMTAAEIDSFYTVFIKAAITPSWSGILSAFRYNPDGVVAHGMWILKAQRAGYEGRFFPLQIWVDATPNAAFEVINNRSTGIMHKISQYHASVYADYVTGAFGGSNLPSDIYDGTTQVVTATSGNSSLNNSGSQRTSFYQTLIDYEKRVKVLPGFGSTTSTSLRRHTYSPFQR